MKKYLLTLLVIIGIVVVYFFVKTNTPTISSIPAGWATYTGNGVQFSYPETFGANVWKAVTRPPVVTVVPANKDPIVVGCPMLKDAASIVASGAGKSDDISYSFYKGQDIGAGQLYTSTCYIFSGATANYVIDFEIHSHSGCGNGNCGAYCGTEFEQECKDFAMEKDVDQIIEKIISTVKIVK